MLVKYVLYPKYIKNEVAGIIICFVVMIPFTVLLSLIGGIPASAVIISMCGIAFISTAANLFMSYYNMNFAPFGKDGFVAGIMNCSASIGMIAQNYGFNAVADGFGWHAVSNLWVAMSVIATVLGIIALPIFNRFKKKHSEILMQSK